MTLENAQKAFIKSTVNQFGVNSPSNIHVSPGVHRCPKPEDEPSNRREKSYREAVESLAWLSIMTKLEIPSYLRSVARRSHNSTDSPF